LRSRGMSLPALPAGKIKLTGIALWRPTAAGRASGGCKR